MKDYKADASGFAAIRRATGLSQQKFSERLGITKSAVENIELARSPVSSDLAATIGTLTGAVPWTISSAQGPRDFKNEPYSAQSWKQWREYQFDKDQIKKLAVLSQDYLGILLEAGAANSAGEQTSPVFRSVLIDLNRFLFSQVQKHQLEARVNAVIRDQLSKIEEGHTTVEKLKHIFRDSPEWKRYERREWKRMTKARFTCQRVPLFTPFLGFWKSGDGTPAFANQIRSERHIYDLEVAGQRFRVAKDYHGIDLLVSEANVDKILSLASLKRKRKPKD